MIRMISITFPFYLLCLFYVLSLTEASCKPKPRVLWRFDGRCGSEFPLPSGQPGQCDPNGDRPCCSDFGYCGVSPSHCRCKGCFDFRRSYSAIYYRDPRYYYNHLPPRYVHYVVQDPGCYFSLEEPTGFLQSPNYPNPYPLGRNCCYDIQRPSDDYCGVSIQVETLDVGRPEEDGYCKKDWITLPSCAPERGTRICGNDTRQFYQYIFQPGADAIRFVFHAGKLNERRRGFRIKYDLEKTCPGPYQTQSLPISPIPGTNEAPCYTRITDSRGTINTPYFPDPYPVELDCVYEFVRTNPNVCGLEMRSVRFIMDDPLSTPFGGACTDFLHLPSCGFLCGNVDFSWIVEFQPGAKSLKFHFHSDHNTTMPVSPPGFLVNFQHVTRCS